MTLDWDKVFCWVWVCTPPLHTPIQPDKPPLHPLHCRPIPLLHHASKCAIQAHPEINNNSKKKKKQSRQKEENEKKETGTNKHWREKRNSQQRKANENETEEKAEEQTDTDVISNCSKKVLFDSCMNALQINLHTSHLRIITNQFQSSRKKKDKWILLNSFCLNSLK